MEYHLDREIRLLEETEYKLLYTWFLQEFSKEGTALAPKVIPWEWSLDLYATELTYIRRFATSTDDASHSGEKFIGAAPIVRSREMSSSDIDPLPGPVPFNLKLERDREKRSNQHDHDQHSNTLERLSHSHGANDVACNQEFQGGSIDQHPNEIFNRVQAWK